MAHHFSTIAIDAHNAAFNGGSKINLVSLSIGDANQRPNSNTVDANHINTNISLSKLLGLTLVIVFSP